MHVGECHWMSLCHQHAKTPHMPMLISGSSFNDRPSPNDLPSTASLHGAHSLLCDGLQGGHSFSVRMPVDSQTYPIFLTQSDESRDSGIRIPMLAF